MYIQKLKITLNFNLFLTLLLIITSIKVIYEVNNIESKYDINTKKIIGIVTNIEKYDDLFILTIKSNENLLVYSYNKLDVDLGDTIEVCGSLKYLEVNTNFNLFNYRNYMLSKNIHYKMNAKTVNIIKKNTNILYKIKNYLIRIIDKKSGSEYLHTFILGNNKYLNSNIIKMYRENGISHLFSVSGMHIVLLSSVIYFVLNKITKANIKYVIVIIFLLFYMFLTSFTPSVIRSTLLYIFITISKKFNLKLSTSKILLLIMIIVLFINPYNIYNNGFILSYVISFYLINFNRIINNFNNYFVKILITSLIAFFASIPILINNYFSINLMTVFNNLIFVPFISMVIFPLSFFVLFIPKLDFIYNILLNLLENLSLFIFKFKIEIILCKMNLPAIVLYYLIITFVLFKLFKKKYQYLILIIILLFIHKNINYIKNNPYITFLDVGQGDCALIHLPYNKGDILIDTG